MTEVARRVEVLDISLFDAIETQLTSNDRRSMLALHAAWGEIYGFFDYLEIGSHLGGSLQAVVRDPACRSIISIDSRPSLQPDERGFVYEYPSNSTERMVQELERLDGADIGKLVTFDATTESLSLESVPSKVNACFIDGEHTDAAAVRDARFCLAAIDRSGCIAFHDIQVVYRGVCDFLEELEEGGIPHRSYYLPDAMFAIEVGPSRIIDCAPLRQAVLENAEGYLWSLTHNDFYRERYRRSVRHRSAEAARRVRRRLKRGSSSQP